MQGFINDQSSTVTSLPAIGSGPGTAAYSNSFALRPTYKLLEAGVTASIGFTTQCEVDVTTAADFFLPYDFGSAKVGWEYVSGAMNRNAANDYTLYLDVDEDRCTELTSEAGGVIDLYYARNIPDTVGPLALRATYGYDLARYTEEGVRFFMAHITAILSPTHTPADPPIWVYDQDDGGISLFLVHD
jgi:hypothetical protein